MFYGNNPDTIKELTDILDKYFNVFSDELCDISRKEFELLVEYDILHIYGIYYSKMNAAQKEQLCSLVVSMFGLSDDFNVFSDSLTDVSDDYVPVVLRLNSRLSKGDYTKHHVPEKNYGVFKGINYWLLFINSTRYIISVWDKNDSFSTFLALTNLAYFEGLALLFLDKDIRNEYFSNISKGLYKCSSYDELVDFLYNENKDNPDWDDEVDLDLLDGMIEDRTNQNDIDSIGISEIDDCIRFIKKLHTKYEPVIEKADTGIVFISDETGIIIEKNIDIDGFDCYFCSLQKSDNRYIIIYQEDNHINDIIDDDNEWSEFQKKIYYEDMKEMSHTGIVYIIYILDDNSDNIPIQKIESNKTYGRKYVFTERETITFINGIVRTGNEQLDLTSPVQVWERILREEHLSACMTEPYASKKVESYITGSRFDADYTHDDDYNAIKGSVIPTIKWVKSLETSGFRDFCFDEAVMSFGQVNLFYGANGSGKTSVLEAIEYALTADVRRVKDFKVKMPTLETPKIDVYDREAGVHSFYPKKAKKYTKEIERVWYGVPTGRTKTNLNENFNRFNSFDSEAAYNFIHSSDNTGESFSSMFGNLMFGETVVDHEKKWQRYKKAFEDRYSELRSALQEARSMAEYYEQSLSQKSTVSVSDELEKLLEEIKYKAKSTLPKETIDRYNKLQESLTLIKKYVDCLDNEDLSDQQFSNIHDIISETKKKGTQYSSEKKAKSDEIVRLAEANRSLKQQVIEEREKLSEVTENTELVQIEINNWHIVQKVLNDNDTIILVDDLISELDNIVSDLEQIAAIERRTEIVRFLNSGVYDTISEDEYNTVKEKYTLCCDKKTKLETTLSEKKKDLGKREKEYVEFRKLGKKIANSGKCPLCGYDHGSLEQLMALIDTVTVLNDDIGDILAQIETIEAEITNNETIIDRENLIRKALIGFGELRSTVGFVDEHYGDFNSILLFIRSKSSKTKRKAEITEQLRVLEEQGFSKDNISACKRYTKVNPMYLSFAKSKAGTFDVYLDEKLSEYKSNELSIQSKITSYEKAINDNNSASELCNEDIKHLNALIDGLELDHNRALEQAYENICSKFVISPNMEVGSWTEDFYSLLDRCDLEVERLSELDSIELEKQWLKEYKDKIKRLTPMAERCATAVQVFEKIPSLNSFVEQGIRANIEQISKFFKWMHHSGEFEMLGIDDEGIYAIRGMSQEKIRTYEMSTGQRATIAMAVMFSLHLAAPDAPQFLLLDEPLATMDDTQVLNVLDILKSMAEQGTQIFFTSANGIMIDLFRKCFKNKSYDYKEYEFVKRVNRPSEINETSINQAKSIEELTLDDLTLDYVQFAEIREVLRRNQAKLVNEDDIKYETDSEDTDETVSDEFDDLDDSDIEDDTFYSGLTPYETQLLSTILFNDSDVLIEKLKGFPQYKAVVEDINDKAIDYFGESIINNDDMIPRIEEEYCDELVQQYNQFRALGDI
ncbi:MAG: hypothetical protein IK999_08785 [Ruminococcus sp.]|nr:hypothetical protein [Ruminococcus sp.]